MTTTICTTEWPGSNVASIKSPTAAWSASRPMFLGHACEKAVSMLGIFKSDG